MDQISTVVPIISISAVAPFINIYQLRLCRDDFVYVFGQWETLLHCNVTSHWQGAYTKWSLIKAGTCNCIHCFMHDIINHPCHKFNGNLTKQQLKSGHRCVITDHYFLFISFFFLLYLFLTFNYLFNFKVITYPCPKHNAESANLY